MTDRRADRSDAQGRGAAAWVSTTSASRRRFAAGSSAFLDWLEAGHAAGMDYMQRQRRSDGIPARLLEGVRSVVDGQPRLRQKTVPELVQPGSGQGGPLRPRADYHRVLWDKLEELLAWLRRRMPESSRPGRRRHGPLAGTRLRPAGGLGWIGKNTMLINRALGSFTVLGALLVDLRAGLPTTPHRRRSLRNLHPLPGRLPDRGVRLCLSARRPPLHQLLDDRAQGTDRRGDRRRASWLGIRLRHLPGRLPLEPQGARRVGWPSWRRRPEWTDPDLIEWLDRDREPSGETACEALRSCANQAGRPGAQCRAGAGAAASRGGGARPGSKACRSR